MPSFNFIAPYYDFLSRLVYGSSLNQAKKCFLSVLPPDARILLVGGGTGEILNDLMKILPQSTVDFLEPSSGMIDIARRKLKPEFSNRIRFICGDHRAIPGGEKYDAVTTFFVLDCLTQAEAKDFGRTITESLKQNGVWLFADFFAEKNILHQLLIWFMYRFFRIVAGIHARRIPDYDLIFQSLKFNCTNQQFFLKGLIQSKIYKKSNYHSIKEV